MVDISTGTALLAAATVFGAFIGAIVQMVIRKRKERRETEALRKSLLAELKSNSDIDDERWLFAGEVEDLDDMFPYEVYKSNTSKIGRLSPEEAEKVVNFYTGLLRYKGISEHSDGKNENGKETTKGLLKDLESARKNTIEKIEENMNGTQNNTNMNRNNIGAILYLRESTRDVIGGALGGVVATWLLADIPQALFISVVLFCVSLLGFFYYLFDRMAVGERTSDEIVSN